MANLNRIFSLPIGPWTAGELIASFVIMLAALVARAVITNLIAKRLGALAGKTETDADDMAVKALAGPLGLIALVLGAYLAFRILATAQPELLDPGRTIMKILIVLVAGLALFRLADAVSVGMMEIAGRTESRLDDQLIPLLRKTAKVLIAIMIFVLTVQNLGYSVSGLLAGLGIGGLAFALAAKDTIANVFGSVTILIDRPFSTGDWVTADGADGVVEEIGLRSTRIRTFAKTLVSIPNQQLANATIENHSLMPKRRVKMTVGVTYDTDSRQMSELVERVESLLRSRQDIHQEFILVKFIEFGASSLDLFVYYFSVSTDWVEHLRVRQEVNLAIMDIVEQMGLSIAFPTRTVHLVGDGAAPGSD